MQVNLEIVNQHPVIHFSGEISGSIEDELMLAMDKIEPIKKILYFNFVQMDYINSSGIAVLIAVVTGHKKYPFQYTFCGLNTHFRKIIEVVGLNDFVRISDTLEDALDDAQKDTNNQANP